MPLLVKPTLDGGRQGVRWNGAMSSLLDSLHGVAQGSKAGLLLLTFVIMVNFELLRNAVGYADNTLNSKSRVAGLNSDSEVLIGLSKELSLVLNPSKTVFQILLMVPQLLLPTGTVKKALGRTQHSSTNVSRRLLARKMMTRLHGLPPGAALDGS